MEILTKRQSREADKIMYAKNVPEIALIENAGFALACAIEKRYDKRPVFVLCGTGANGADGFAAAQVLFKHGWPVQAALLGNTAAMSDTAKAVAARFKGPVVSPSLKSLDRLKSLNGLIVDALFGTGLNRPLTADIADFINKINETSLPCVAADIPSGIDADTGFFLPTAPFCAMTVTFCRPKPAHFLYPAKERIGSLVVADIGIDDDAVAETKPYLFTNDENSSDLPRPDFSSHKYNRGAVLICGGTMTGAGRLAADAAARAGAGLVKVACPPELLSFYALSSKSQLTVPVDTTEDFEKNVLDKKTSAVAIGMGFGVSQKLKDFLDIIVRSGKPFVADADALGFLKSYGGTLARTVATPHAGEFIRMFPELKAFPKTEQAIRAARELGCVVILKGADTVIAAPSGKAAINHETSFGLSTAGSGDVLSGITAAILAQGLPPFEAACAAVRLHSKAGIAAGERPVAEDIIAALRS